VLHVANQIKTTSPKLIEAVKVAHFNPGQAFYYDSFYYYIYCC
jgi:hypothetical protein